MSRIFDALRQSEKDKNPEAERWSMLNEKFAASGSVESAEPAEESPLLPPELSSMLPVPDFAAQSGLPPMANPEAWTPAPDAAEFLPRSLASVVASPEVDLSQCKVVDATPAPTLVALSSERELGAEKFRVLGARLSNIRLGANIGILQVTSSVQGEGKSLVSVNLAMTLAKRFAQKVLLIEGDLRKPAACAMLGLKHQMGIGEWWMDQEAAIGDYILRVGETGMCILPAGNVAHPASVLQSSRTADMLAAVARHFDWVIIDTPPLLPMADSNLWARVSDATLLVVRKGAVTRSALKKAVDSLDNPKLVGIVLNDANDYDQVNYYGQYNMPSNEVESALRKAVAR